MAFNKINTESADGDFIPFIKYDAKAGRWFNKTDDGELEEIDLDAAVFDMANIKSGWIAFFEGQGPDAVWDEGDQIGPRPSDKHRRGFQVLVYSKNILGGVREFSSNAKCVCQAINELYDAYEDGVKKGKLPVVECSDITPVKSAKSTNYKPELEITKWVDAPAAFDEARAGAADDDDDDDVPPPKEKKKDKKKKKKRSEADSEF